MPGTVSHDSFPAASTASGLPNRWSRARAETVEDALPFDDSAGPDDIVADLQREGLDP
jgi:hypothetical protein